jgi:hypothetical protein
LRRRRARLAIAALCLFTFVACAPTVWAVSVSVSEFDLRGEPGEEVRASFSVFNDDAEAVDVEISIADWDLDVDGVTRFHPPVAIPRSCASWLDVAPTRFLLPPDGEAEIVVSLRIPEAARGTYWTGLLVRVTTASSESSRDDLQPVRQFLVRILQSAMPLSPDGAVRGVRIGGLMPLGVEIRFENTGDALLAGVNGLVAVEDRSGVRLGEISIPPFDVLPGTAANRVVHWDAEPLPAGDYLVRAVVDFGADHLVAGQIVLRVRELDLVPLAVGAATPADLDGDGLCEDVDGSGSFDSADPALLEKALESSAVRVNARAFDFDNDGDVTIADVAWLEELVLRRSD